MAVAIVHDAQYGVAFVAGGTGDVPKRFLAPQPDTQYLARPHALEPEFCPNESHRADFTGNVDVMVRLYGWRLYGHVPNYTPNALRCRVFGHA